MNSAFAQREESLERTGIEEEERRVNIHFTWEIIRELRLLVIFSAWPRSINGYFHKPKL